MSAINDGGYAFPIPDTHYPNGEVHYGTPGMTLRDYFAAKAMQALIGQPARWANSAGSLKMSENDYLGAFSYGMADAMLKAREGA